MNRTVIVDIDNCIADDEHRLHLIDYSDADLESRYARYHEASLLDPYHLIPPLHHPGLWPRDQLHALFVTAMPERYRALRTDWLNHQLNPNLKWELVMRPDADHRPSPEMKVDAIMFWLANNHPGKAPREVFGEAYDDRTDVLLAYKREFNIPTTLHCLNIRVDAHEVNCTTPIDLADPVTSDAAYHLDMMAETFRERNAVYKDNYQIVGKVMAAMFPNGVHLKTQADFERWHLFELKIVKLTRFAVTGLMHTDSIVDDGVYSAMIRSILDEDPNPITGD